MQTHGNNQTKHHLTSIMLDIIVTLDRFNSAELAQLHALLERYAPQHVVSAASQEPVSAATFQPATVPHTHMDDYGRTWGVIDEYTWRIFSARIRHVDRTITPPFRFELTNAERTTIYESHNRYRSIKSARKAAIDRIDALRDHPSEHIDTQINQ